MKHRRSAAFEKFISLRFYWALASKNELVNDIGFHKKYFHFRKGMYSCNNVLVTTKKNDLDHNSTFFRLRAQEPSRGKFSVLCEKGEVLTDIT